MQQFVLAVVAALAASWALAGAEERRHIREGMSEGEVLVKLGKPDSESQDSGGGARTTVKRWIYLPASSDPQTLTTIVLRSGQVVEVTRKISR